MNRLFIDGHELRQVKPGVVLVTDGSDGTTRRLVGPDLTKENAKEYIRKATAEFKYAFG
jgi:urocanate hydratase